MEALDVLAPGRSVYEFHIFGANADGEVPEKAKRIHLQTCFGDLAAKAVARPLALAHTGPVDVARVGDEPWADRYVGTCAPRWPGTTSRATLFERLD